VPVELEVRVEDSAPRTTLYDVDVGECEAVPHTVEKILTLLLRDLYLVRLPHVQPFQLRAVRQLAEGLGESPRVDAGTQTIHFEVLDCLQPHFK